MLVFETTLCVLAVVKSVQIARAQLYTSKVLSTMLRDTVAYFGGILVIIIANLVIWFAARVSAYTSLSVAARLLRKRQATLFAVAIG